MNLVIVIISVSSGGTWRTDYIFRDVLLILETNTILYSTNSFSAGIDYPPLSITFPTTPKRR